MSLTCALVSITMKKSYILLSALFSALIGCASVRTTPAESLPTIRTSLGPQAVEAISRPEHVYAVLLHQPSDEYYSEHVTERSLKVEVSPFLARRAANLILDRRSYAGIDRSCMPCQDIRLIFVRGAVEVRVDYCLHCDVLSAYGPKTSAINMFLDQNLHAKTSALFQAIFPEDAILRAIRPRTM